MNTHRGQALYKRAKQIIPGGTQLLSKRPEMFAPEQWPPYYQQAKGCTVTDIDNNRYIDMSSMGIGSCLLGYAHPAVNEAVIKAIQAGSMSTLNCPVEVELAELLLSLHPWADMVRYARSGGEIMSIAVRIARAATGKEIVAFCGYHGWHDWYVSANLANGGNLDGQLLPGIEPNGVPKTLTGTVLPFHYNAIGELEQIFDRYGSKVGVIVMEPYRYQGPKEGFLEKVRTLATKHHCVLIFDEITSGWRNTIGGIHMKLGIEPDMAVFAKAISNGFPMAAVIGKREVMDAAQGSFISSTYWTERIGPTAAIATIQAFQNESIPSVLSARGTEVMRIWKTMAKASKIEIEIEGTPALSHFSFLHQEATVLTTLLTQELLKRGVLGNTAYYASAGHDEQACRSYEEAFGEVCHILRNAIDSGNPKKSLEGPVKHQGFARLT
ncbi:MAG: aminotransferase class III-fold pyridoxal phosphate-dependent enzyme [Sphaerochaetaceae bacterium]